MMLTKQAKEFLDLVEESEDAGFDAIDRMDKRIEKIIMEDGDINLDKQLDHLKLEVRKKVHWANIARSLSRELNTVNE